MTKTPAATRIYIVRGADGAPVSLAEACSQAEALRLHTESLGLSAAPASALDAVRLRDLPVLARAQAGSLPDEFEAYVEGEPQGAAPLAGDGRDLTAAEQASYEAQGAARFAQHHRGMA